MSKLLFKRLALPLALSVALLTGCGTQQSPSAQNNATGSAPSSVTTTQDSAATAQGSAVSSAASRQDKEIQLAQAAFGIDLTGLTPETRGEEGQLLQETYAVSDGNVVFEWRGDSAIPDSLYHFLSENSSADTQNYDAPDSIGQTAQKFLSELYGISVSDKPAGVYGYQSRIGVLMQAEDGTYWHVQFPADNPDTVLGCQKLGTQENAEQFYQTQSAKKLR